MEKLLTLLGPLLLAFYVASEIAPRCTQTSSKEIAKVFEKVAGVLLPLLILSIVRRTEITNELWLLLILGFFIPIIFYFMVPWISKAVSGPKVIGADYNTNRLLFSSFGGGNRGNLILMILIASDSISKNVTPNYVALDFGNLLCVVTLGFLLLAKDKNEPDGDYRLSDIVNKVLKAPGFYATILVALQLPGLRETHLGNLFTAFDPTIKSVGNILFPFFSFFVFLALFIRSEHLSEIVKKSPPILRLSLASRLMPAVALLIASVYVNQDILIAIAVLIVMPPSSYLWSKITGKYSDSQDIEANYLVPNIFYFAMLLGAYLYAAINL